MIGIVVISAGIAQRIAVRIQISHPEQRGVLFPIREAFHQREQGAAFPGAHQAALEQRAMIWIQPIIWVG